MSSNILKIFKYTFLISVSILMFVAKSHAQINLVPNPSFEVYDTCPSYSNAHPNDPYRAIYYATPWFQPYTVESSTDYFNACDTSTNELGTPNNYEGYQIARTGFAYVGFTTGYVIPPNNAREYLEVRLTDSLIFGRKYCVSFYVSFANNSRRATDGLEAYLSSTPVYYSSPAYGVLNNITPQIQNPSGNVIQDTLNWVQVYGEMIAAGGEKYITIGNFRDDANTTMIQVSNTGHLYSYYYIDDVSVVYCDSDVGINENAIKDFTISPNPAKEKMDVSFSNSNGVKTISIFSADGKLIKKINVVAGNSKISIDVNGLSNGIYFLEIMSPSNTLRKKFIVLK